MKPHDAAAPVLYHTDPQPLTPGEVYRFDIEVLPVPMSSDKATASGSRSPTAIRP